MECRDWKLTADRSIGVAGTIASDERTKGQGKNYGSIGTIHFIGGFFTFG